MPKVNLSQGILIFILLVIFLLNQKNADAVDLNLQGLLQSGFDIGSGLVKKTPDFFPSAFELFTASKNLIAGYPFKVAAAAVNSICSAAVVSNSLHPRFTPNVSHMHFQLRTPCKRYSYPLTNIEGLLKNHAFNPNKKVVILATGWTTTVDNTDTINVMAKAYICRGDHNFLAVDAASFVATLYTWSAFNTEAIGQYIGLGLVEMIKVVPVENIHLIGHSLGAHICGAAARYFYYKTGKILPRITGLDPASPCFNEGQNLSGLFRGDAQFVDIIHSNPGVLGKRDPIGDADFYPGGVDPLPAGCFSIVCAHSRSWWYYTETIYPGNELNFLAKRCNSLARNLEIECPGDDYAMGFACSPHAKGNFFLNINLQPPYGKYGRYDWTSKNNRCGNCKRSIDNTSARIMSSG